MTIAEPPNLKLETLKILSADLLKQYEELVNAAGSVLAATVTARTLLLAAGQSQDPVLGAMFERAMDTLDRVVGAFAQRSSAALGTQNQIQSGARDMVVKG